MTAKASKAKVWFVLIGHCILSIYWFIKRVVNHSLRIHLMVAVMDATATAAAVTKTDRYPIHNS